MCYGFLRNISKQKCNSSKFLFSHNLCWFIRLLHLMLLYARLIILSEDDGGYFRTHRIRLTCDID